MLNNNKLCKLLKVKHPIIQAPMAGASTPQMAAAAANSGAVGSLGCAMMSADTYLETFQKTKAMTNGVLNMNFFCHDAPKMDHEKIRLANDRLKPFYDKLGIDTMPEAKPTHFPFGGELAEAVISTAPNIVSFHFGLPETHYIEALKANGCIILSSATTVAEAFDLQKKGVDAIIAQGWEAGGHHGFYLQSETAGIGTMALVPQLVDAVDVPIIAAGGIADGRGIVAALALGASGVQIGTAFLTSEESAVPPAHKASLIASDGSNTTLTKAFSGRPARGIKNHYSNSLSDIEEHLPDFPIMNTLTAPLRKISADHDSPDYVAQWSGQAVGLNRNSKTAELIEALIAESKAIIENFQS